MFKKFQKLALALIIIFGINIVPSTCFGQVNLPDSYKPIHAPVLKEEGKKFDTDTISYLIQYAISTLLYLAGALGVLLIIYIGGKYVSSAGDSTKVEAAKKALLWTLGGLVLMIFSYVLVSNLITWIFKIQET